MTPPPARTGDTDLRASDADRERAVERLRRHAGAGRLDAEELEDRLERALAARTRGELKALLADLPRSREGRGRGAAHCGREHVRVYATTMALLVAIWALTGAGYFWPVWPMLGWGVFVLPDLRAARRRPALERAPLL